MIWTLIILVTITAVRPDGIKVTPIHNAGIYFETLGKVEFYSSEWKIVVYYDLTGINLGVTYVKKHTTEINQLCGVLLNEPAFSQVCNHTVLEMNHLVHDVEQNLILLDPKLRTKRSLFGIIGVVSKSLFGTLNEQDAEYYDKQIERLKGNEEYLKLLIKNQTMILETTANIFNKSINEIQMQFITLNNKYRTLRGFMDELYNATYANRIVTELESLTTLNTLLILRYQNIVNTLVDLVTDVRHGKPHPLIITPHQIELILTTIRREINGDLRLPSTVKETNLLSIYRMGEMSTTALNDKIIFEFRIPLPYKEDYQLFKIHSLPTIYKNDFAFIQPSSEYLIVDYEREHFYNMNAHELEHCKTDGYEQYLCQLYHPIFNVNEDNLMCEINLLKREYSMLQRCDFRTSNQTTFWVQLSQTNKWLYSTRTNLTADVICKQLITPQTLIGTGIIEINDNCYLRTKTLTIRAYNTNVTELKKNFVPSLNVESIFNRTASEQLRPGTIGKIGLIKYSTPDELKKLSEQIGILREQEGKDLEPIDPHTVHHYTLGYFLLSMVLLIIFYITYPKWIFCNKQNRSETNKESDNAEKPDQKHQVQLTRA